MEIVFNSHVTELLNIFLKSQSCLHVKTRKEMKTTTFKLPDMYGKSIIITTWKLVTQPANGGGEQPSN